jgi:hypothetical protein
MPKKFLHQKVSSLSNTPNIRLIEGGGITSETHGNILKNDSRHYQESTD